MFFPFSFVLPITTPLLYRGNGQNQHTQRPSLPQLCCYHMLYVLYLCNVNAQRTPLMSDDRITEIGVLHWPAKIGKRGMSLRISH